MENRGFKVKQWLAALAASIVLTASVSQFTRAQTTATEPILGNVWTLASLTTAMPPANIGVNTIAVTSDSGLVYNTGTNWQPVYFRFTTTTTSIAATALLLGGCASVNVTVTGATTSMTALATPQVSPGNGIQWQAYVSAANTVTVQECALLAVTTTATAYNVKVFP